MLIIFEGLDKSGKSTMANMLQQHKHAIMIKKTYNKQLYPIDYSKASVYDWQAILDRVILPNKDLMFIADRSFLTQTAYQVCLGHGEHAITAEQTAMYNNYCEVVKTMPHLVVYCTSKRYELDSMVTNLRTRAKLNDLYIDLLKQSGMHHLILDMDNATMHDNYNKILTTIKQFAE